MHNLGGISLETRRTHQRIRSIIWPLLNSRSSFLFTMILRAFLITGAEYRWATASSMTRFLLTLLLFRCACSRTGEKASERVSATFRVMKETPIASNTKAAPRQKKEGKKERKTEREREKTSQIRRT